MTSLNATRTYRRILLATAGILLLVATGAASAKDESASSRQVGAKSLPVVMGVPVTVHDKDHDHKGDHANKRDKDHDGDGHANKKHKHKDEYADHKLKCENIIVPTAECGVSSKDPVGNTHPSGADLPH